MSHSILTSLPIIPVLVDEASRVVTTLWIIPWFKDGMRDLMLGLIILRDFLILHF